MTPTNDTPTVRTKPVSSNKHPGEIRHFLIDTGELIALSSKLLPKIESSQDHVKIVHAIVKTQLDLRMRWIKSPSDHLAITLSQFPQFKESCSQELRSIDYKLTDLADAADNVINEIVDDGTWMIWHIRTLGSDILLEMTGDYRIQDWERRMESGEWR